ncbi:restriction endonuclease subunit S [Alteribacillus iranensis]|uniref:restriction endonuclease subunit S n=1 Tax=Alteribacillus iranensis TaxID=930128 RepID=UPI001C42F6CD|nr:restriction endonuclease subunit S [Alteribacillus iranensis]
MSEKKWETKNLEQVTDNRMKHSLVGGPFGSDLKVSDYTELGVRVIQLQNIKDGFFNEEYKIYTSASKADELIKCNIYPGDIIIAKMAEPLARACIVPESEERYVMASDGIRLVVDEDRFDKKYVLYYINSPLFRNQAISNSTGTTRLRIGLSTLKKLKLLIPPLKEQQKIAAILTSVDEAIEKTEAIIEQTEKVKKGVMQQLLTKGIGHTKFKKTEIGEIPEGWECVPLGKLIKVQGGYAFKSKDAKQVGTKWVKIANVGIGEITWSDQSFLPNEFLNEYSEYVLDENDLVMAMTRPVIRNQAKVARLDEKDTPSLLNQRVCRFKIKDSLNSEFFYQFARSRYFANEISLRIAGTDPPNISSGQIESILMPLPPKEEQDEISKILLTHDKKISTENSRYHQLNVLKQGLMQILLTGKVRVKVDEDQEVPS